IKVLLQMKHKTLVKSLHSDSLNPYIDLNDSPFYVVQEAREWTAVRDAHGQALPRRAGVSSFGFGGVNAHVVLEEYIPSAVTAPVADGPIVVVLSARNEERLREQVQQLLAFISTPQAEMKIGLADLAYTLQVGREAMEERLGLVVDSLADLRDKLTRFLAGNDGADELHRGQVRRNKDAMAAFSADEDMAHTVRSWVEKGKFGKLLDLWVKGYGLDWNGLYGDRKPRRISLPTYSFAKESYWVPAGHAGLSTAPAVGAMLHPLMQRNSSNLSGPRFSSRFDGSEFFLADHVVLDNPVLPGVAQLEMARFAASEAMDGAGKLHLKDVVWARPALVGSEGLELHLSLYPEGNGEVSYEIHADIADGEIVYGHGVVTDVIEDTTPAIHDLAALRQQCTQTHLNAVQCYAVFDELGLHYGDGFQGLSELFVGKQLALARIMLPASVHASKDSYLLHPSMLDAALQASVGLQISANAGDLTLMLPFVLGALDVLAPCTSSMWAVVRHSTGRASSDAVHSVDIDLCDDNGVPCLRFKQLGLRVLTTPPTGSSNRDMDSEDVTSHLEAHQVSDSVLQPAPMEREKAAVATSATDASDDIQERASRYFVRFLSATLKLPTHRIDPRAQMETYGIDSLLVLDLTRALEKQFGPLPKTLFFEYQTIAALSGYFVQHHQAAMAALLGESRTVAAAVSTPSASKIDKPASASPSRRSRYETRSRISKDVRDEVGEIAIIGVAGRYPQAGNLEQFWANLSQGKDSITEIPPERWDHKRYFDEDRTKPGKSYGKWGGFIDGVDLFDPLFFNISPREAELMDPQERLFLECVHATLEDAGYTRDNVAEDSNVGVFVGVMYEEYQLYGAQEQALGRPIAVPGHPASIANRISYFCNFNGPSMALDTMCSSSLTAIHLACQSLQRGGCSVAVAGGVNVSVHPNKYLMLAQGKFISGKGRCESFGEGGEGYVPGEGVGAVLLKPLAQAKADGDHIYGVIKATAINHGGKTNGYTVPNPNAQAKVIERALREGGVDARSVSYIEAHGTGTSLGDPIEIAGLSKAFRNWTQDTQFCAIGSAKSNIGHCESAAGIAGVTKVLLQLKHQQLVPSLHSSVLNPNIDFDGTPFVVQQELTAWPRPMLEVAGAKWEGPRIAGISSFGAGGANAHVVIEEYVAPVVSQAASGPALIVLSARHDDRLREHAHQLLSAIASDTNLALADLAYTLQVGREAMEERLALVVNSLDELREKMSAYVAGEAAIEDLYRGQVNRNKETLAVLATDDDIGTAVESWIAKGKFGKLLDLWVKGLAFDWQRLYGAVHPRRISLPTYPFARERYWIEVSATQSMNPALTGGMLHPLLHRNTSSFAMQRFSSHFSGEEFFLADHMARGTRILPGVAQLEMAHRAASAAIDEDCQLQLKNIAWMRPVAVGADGLDLHIALLPQANGEISFEIYRDAEDGETVAYSQGTVVAVASAQPSTATAHDLAALREQCADTHLSAAQCYALFERMGLHYGAGFQGLSELFVGPQQVLARITLPASVPIDGYALHPSLLDAALQAAIGLVRAADDTGEPALMLPIALGSLEVMGPCTDNMWAVVRHSAGSAAGDALQTMDVELCDDAGAICVRFSQLELRASTAIAEPDAAPRTLLTNPVWEVQPAIADRAISRVFARNMVLLCGLDAADADGVQANISDVTCQVFAVDQDLARCYESAAATLLEHILSLSSQPGQHLIQLVVPAQGIGQTMAGLGGMLRTAQLENPRIVGQVICVESGQDVAQVLAENRDSLATQIRYASGVRQVGGWVERQPSLDAVSPWKAQGVYLITGGAGGLGLIFARDIARQANGATLILTGRSPLTAATQAKLSELEASGATVQYRQLDVGDRDAVMQCVRGVTESFGGLHGIIHSAGVLRDSFIIKKTREELHEVLHAKVAGTLHLDEASRELALDSFICFSSISGALGNVGQADYAAANAFMDAFAYYRSGLVAQGLRLGRTLSVNWPLWEEGGMQVDAATRQYLLQQTGMTPLRTASGCAALMQAVSSGLPQVLVAEGRVEQLKTVLLKEALVQPIAVAVEADRAVPMVEDLREKTIRHLIRLLSTTLKLPAHKIDANARLEAYGIDSVMVMDLTLRLEKSFGSLSKTLFFEYQTMAALADYFLQAHRAKLVELLDEKAIATAPAAVARPRGDSVAAPAIRRRSRFDLRSADRGISEIAIIGMAGRYPQASNLEQFWANLSQGKDSITEIPSERWDHSLYFDEDRSKAGKTYGKWGGFIDGVDLFDPRFFNISPREAEQIDPQERLFLECVHATLEDAGYTRDNLAEDANVGVFVGVMYEEYQLYGAQEQVQGRPIAVPGSPASIANRISYFCNFNGPSMALDTMCSSSLTAIHLACQSLQRGGCAVAVAGGVNVSVHPNKYLMLAQGKFISGKGRCESFGEGGEGYVPGEGVGAVLLKPLAQAKADGDHIYGVIKATAINHGGKTNGYTVPNPNAQAKVIERALREGGIDARSVSYIEAHGTGTSLGDPIEIAGLSKAFRNWTQDTQFCAIGSAKSNIGHCESAAGIAGVTKVLLQLKHQQLVPSLHSSVLNPNIDFDGTPFVVQQELAAWPRPMLEVGGAKREGPRIAGISSFGAGGANAHVVIEEYIAPTVTQAASGPALIVLSARHEDRLREQVQRLLAAIASSPDMALADLAYTLQVGREAMEERLALVVNSLDELREKLSAYVAGETAIDDLYRGQVKRNKDALAALAGDDDMATIVEAWIAKGKFGKLLDLWVKGLAFDWQRLYGAEQIRLRRISLPTYPFARERYWIQTGPVQSVISSGTGAALHPLLHRNTSDVAGLRFSTHLSGEEFFLTDHVVQGARVLPGVAQLEMARRAVSEVIGETAPIALNDVVWVRPIVVGPDGLMLHIALYPEEAGDMGFEIYSEGEDGEALVHSQGMAAVNGQDLTLAGTAYDLAALREQCTQAHWDAQACYAVFERMGLHYGPGFQGLSDLFVGPQQVLARITLPASVQMDGYALHPSLLDAALQATLGLQMGEGSEAGKVTLMLPFALGALEARAPCSVAMWAVVRHSTGSKLGDAVQRLDIDLCDEHGAVCVRFKQFSLRPFTASAANSEAAPAPRQAESTARAVMHNAPIQTLLLHPEWTVQPAGADSATDRVFAQRLVMLCGLDAVAADRVQAQMPGVACIVFAAEQDLASSYERAASALLEQLQSLGSQPGKQLIQVVVPSQGAGQAMAGLSGMLRTAQLENPRIVGQVISVEAGQDVVQAVLENRDSVATQIRYVDGVRQVGGWTERTGATDAASPWKAQGVYLITGGAGGLGLIFAREIARQARNAVLILTGRSPLNEGIQASIRQLETLGAVVRYHAVDVTDALALTQLVQSIPEEFESLDGIIHSAGVVRDSFIAKKTRQQLHEVFSAKVAGTLNLDLASRDMALDCFICFSSIAGAVGNVGQADYAAANAFMDAFAHHRAELVAQGQRYGRTLSVNWPLWDEGGMQVDAATRTMLIQQLGMHALATDSGVLALRQALASGSNQLLVVAGDAARIRQVILGESQETSAVLSTAATNDGGAKANQDDQSLPEKIKRMLVGLVSALIKVKPEDIDGETTLSEYGFDSISLTEFGNALNQQYRIELKPTIFFEYPTLGGLADYLVREHQAVLAPQFTVANNMAPTAAPVVAAPVLERIRARGRSGFRTAVTSRSQAVNEPIAIIGISGQFPQARDIEAFWRNLRDGKDCITEIPLERWDWRAWYGDPAREENKTNITWGGFIDGVDEFDPMFFGISPKEAELMDPQQRLMMLHVWKALEDAGYAGPALSGSDTAIYVGTGATGYGTLINRAHLGGEAYASTGGVPSVGPNRISYLLNWHGPSEPVETACSSSLIALRRGVAAIQNGESSVAVVGGVNTIVTPEAHISFNKAGMLSEDGRCKTFSSEANGYVRGEGVAMLVLKKLSAAERDGDHIYGLVRGTAENHGGRANSLTAPNPKAQAAVVRQAHQQAGTDPRSVTYIEAHGTGTPLGDPVEINGLKVAFKELYAATGESNVTDQHCGLGSVKTNIGHLELAAGVAGVIKVLLQMKHKTLVKSLHSDSLNPYIDLNDSPFYVVQEAREWTAVR
ncbi:MAG TPA: SDR family NAD(P)-dependent oxidoreductase, partial [Rhodanobacter sp.]|nr:SDR family NAD(P)-dependent oxidoreductase [Rhodanobacter sp.]